MIIYNKNENGQPIDENGDVVILKGFTIINQNNVLYFEDLNEFNNYKELTLPPQQWNKELYKATVNDLHNKLFEQYYKQRDYDSRNEIALWVNNPMYQQEAMALLQWYWDTWQLITEHFNVVTEQTADAEGFILTLPVFYF